VTTQRRAFAFVKLGTFSGANEHILRHLSLEFPDLEPAVIDLSELRVFRKRDAVRLTWSVAREYGASACMTKGRMLARMFRTEYAFDELRARVLQQVGSRPFVFTFQTQSLFDASVSGIPHFIYTDHTHLANLSYPGKSATPMASAPWRAKEQLIYDHARLNFTMSSHITRSLIEQYGCSREKVRCVYAGGNIQPAEPQTVGTERFTAKRILFVGLEWERKGGPILLEAFRQVRRAHPTAELVIVGCSPQVSVPGCRILGRVPLAEVARRRLPNSTDQPPFSVCLQPWSPSDSCSWRHLPTACQSLPRTSARFQISSKKVNPDSWLRVGMPASWQGD
jgi:glycosyltransferase involved in cell wall biosynthesis